MNKLMRKNFMFVLSSPSGAGKTTLGRMLLNVNQDLKLSTSVTTREKREGEIDGIDYHYIDKKKFDDLRKNHQFLEYAKVFDFYYGTLENKVTELLNSGNDVLFDIDWQGAKSLKKSDYDIVSVFILPPSIKELENRLKVRNTDSLDIIKSRMHRATHEIIHWNMYDYVIINDNIEESFQKLQSILQAEKLKRNRQNNLGSFIDLLTEEKWELK